MTPVSCHFRCGAAERSFRREVCENSIASIAILVMIHWIIQYMVSSLPAITEIIMINWVGGFTIKEDDLNALFLL